MDFFTDFELDVPIVEITQRVDPLEADRDDPHTIIEEIKENYE